MVLGVIGYSHEMGELYQEGLELQEKGAYNLSVDKYAELINKDSIGFYRNKAIESVKDIPEEYITLLSSKLNEWGKESQEKGDSYNAKKYYNYILDLGDEEYSSKATKALNDMAPKSLDQKPEKREWNPRTPTYNPPHIPNRQGAIDHAIKTSERASQIGEAHNARINQLTKDIADQNAQVDAWVQEHNARIKELEKESVRISEHAERVGKKSTEISKQMRDYNSRMDGHIKTIIKQNAETCENLRGLQSHINELTSEIASKSTKDAERMRDYNSRLEGHIKKIEAQNARIDAWANEHNARMDALTGDIAAQNAEIYEASIRAIDHIDELNKLTNDCLTDILHMYADISLGMCGVPGIVLSMTIEQPEYNNVEIKYISKAPGIVNAILGGAPSIKIFIVEEAIKNAIKISQNAEEVGKKIDRIIEKVMEYVKKNNNNARSYNSNIEYHYSHISALSNEYDGITSKSIEDAERMQDYNAKQNEVLVELSDQNAQLIEDMQDYNTHTNELIEYITRDIEEIESNL